MRSPLCLTILFACAALPVFSTQTSLVIRRPLTAVQSLSASNTSQFSVQTYNNTALLQAINLVEYGIWDAAMYNSDDPMLGPSLRNPAFLQALRTIQEAIQISNLPKVGPGPSAGNSTFPSYVGGSSSSGEAVVILRNESPQDVCYSVEFSSGNFPLPHICNFDNDVLPGQQGGIIVSAFSSEMVSTGNDFNGPFNAIVNGVIGTINGKPAIINGTRGARHEINFASDANGTWYDIDYEFGLSNSTLTPSNIQYTTTGLLATAGESNILAKANEAWQTLTTLQKWELVSYPRYINVNDAFPGTLTGIYHDKQAPAAVSYFFQNTAGLQGYVVPGSYPGFAPPEGSYEAQMMPVADSFAWHVVGEKNMTITAY